MSWELVNAVRATAGELRDALPGLDKKHRPSVAVAGLVARELADRFRVDRGCVNESVDQVAEATGLSTGQVRDALGALDELGWWVADGKGNQHRPTIRRPGPVLLAALEHGGGARDADDEATRGAPPCTPDSNAGDPAMLTDEADRASRGGPGASRGGPSSIAGYPATPRNPRSSPDDSSLTTDSTARVAEPERSDQRPPPADPHDRGTPLWAIGLARLAGPDCSLNDHRRCAWLTATHHDRPHLTDDDLVAELRARHPGTPAPERAPSAAVLAAEAALDHRDQIRIPA